MKLNEKARARAHTHTHFVLNFRDFFNALNLMKKPQITQVAFYFFNLTDIFMVEGHFLYACCIAFAASRQHAPLTQFISGIEVPFCTFGKLNAHIQKPRT